MKIKFLILLLAVGIILVSGCVKQEKTFTYQKVSIQEFSIEIMDDMEKFMESLQRLPNSYAIIYAHPVEETYDAMIGIGWDTKALAEAAKITTVLDYLDANVKGFKSLFGGSDYSQIDAGTLTVNGHKAKFVTYTYITQKELPSKVKLIGWFCESAQRYYNMILTSPEEVWGMYAPTFEHAETTMKCHKTASDCEEITDSAKKDECYFTFALAAKDTSLCEKVIEDIPKNICYAVVTNNANKCEEITDNVGKDSCYGTFATQTKDASVCEKITDSVTKDMCYSVVGSL